MDAVQGRHFAHRVDLALRVRGLDLDLSGRSVIETQPGFGVPVSVTEVVGALGASVEVGLGLSDRGLERLIVLQPVRLV